MNITVRLLVTALLGGLAVLSLPPFDGGPFIIALSIGGLYVLCAHQSRVWPYVLIFFYTYFTIGLSWIANALLISGQEYVWAYPLALFGVPLLVTPFVVLPICLAARYAPLKKGLGACLFTMAYALGELAREYLFTGFPWNIPAFSLANHLAAAQVVSIIGLHGANVLIVGAGVLMAFSVIQNRFVYLVGGIAVIAMMYVYGMAYVQPESEGRAYQTAIIHPAIPQQQKWDSAYLWDNFNILSEITRQAVAASDSQKPLMIIWPETALGLGMIDNTHVRQILKKVMANTPENSLLVSGILRQIDERYFNSLMVYDRRLEVVDAYDKHHLVPFGEYIPFQKWLPFGPINEFSGFQAGSGTKILQASILPPIIPLVCYEVLFARSIPKHDGGIIVNVTNDAWYGESIGPYQHLAISRLRAIESGKPIYRAVNGGISAAYDAYGRVLAQSDFNSRGYLLIN